MPIDIRRIAAAIRPLCLTHGRACPLGGDGWPEVDDAGRRLIEHNAGRLRDPPADPVAWWHAIEARHCSAATPKDREQGLGIFNDQAEQTWRDLIAAAIERRRNR